MKKFLVVFLLLLMICGVVGCTAPEDLPALDQPTVYEGRVIAILWHQHGSSMDTTYLYFEDGQRLVVEHNLILQVGAWYRITLEEYQGGEAVPNMLDIQLIDYALIGGK